MSLFTGVTCPEKLGGIFGLSCYMLMPNKIRDLVPKDSPNQKTKIFMGHGDEDPLVKYEWGMQTAGLLRAVGYLVRLS